jgi:Ran GTPase-activating protein (RanGAP) involved in mRNA processing and transport
MEEAHFSLLLSTILSSNIRSLALDQNPSIPENLLAYLITDDSPLKYLTLRMNKITDAGAKAIAMSLKTNRGLVTLDLWDNAIGKDGAADLAEVIVDCRRFCLSYVKTMY